MKRWIGPLAVCIFAALAAHWAALALAPSVIMDRALATLKDRGIALHAFTTPRRISPQTQMVVRSSPDLFYSLCRYDLSADYSALDITMSEWPGYQSLSFFDAQTNNFATLRGTGETIEVLLAAHSVPAKIEGALIKPPTPTGVVLIRRLAPTQELFDQASEIAKGDRCTYVPEVFAPRPG
jgi:uncharacterized membrane protein